MVASGPNRQISILTALKCRTRNRVHRVNQLNVANKGLALDTATPEFDCKVAFRCWLARLVIDEVLAIFRKNRKLTALTSFQFIWSHEHDTSVAVSRQGCVDRLS